MAEEEGFEPPRLLHPFGFQDRPLQPGLGIPPYSYGGSGRNRTADTRIFSPLLYLLSYRAIVKNIKKMAVSTGLEPAISSVTDWHVNHYTTRPMVAEIGLEPTTSGL